MSSAQFFQNADKTVKNGNEKFNQKPKRPMTAYNFFFQEERRRILAGEDPETAPAINASKMNGSSTGLSSSRKKTPSKQSINLEDQQDNIKSQKRSRYEMVGEESITFEGLGRIIGKRWKDLKTKGAISKYTELAKKASKKYKEDIKKFYDEEMESMLRVGRSFDTAPISGIQTQSNQNINSNEPNAFRDLSLHLSSLHDKLETSTFNYPSSNVVMAPDLNFATPQQSTNHPSNHKRHRPSTPLTGKLTLTTALQGDGTDQSLLSSSFEAHGFAATQSNVPVPFDAPTPILRSNLLRPHEEFSSMVKQQSNSVTGVCDNTLQLLHDSSIHPSIGIQNANIGINGFLSLLGTVESDTVCLLLEELRRCQQP